MFAGRGTRHRMGHDELSFEIGFPATPGPYDPPQTLRDAVQANLRLILLTEREGALLLADGIPWREILSAPVTTPSLGILSGTIRALIQKHEPRCYILNIKVSTEETRVRVEVAVKVKESGEVLNVRVGVALEGGA